MQSRLSHATLIWATVTLALLLAPRAPAQSPFDDAAAYWAFEETGDTIVDSKGIANMTIADATSPTRVPGLVGNALQVNAGNQKYPTTGVDVDALDFNRATLDSFSVAGWVKAYDGSPVFIKMCDLATEYYRGWDFEIADTGAVNFLLRASNLATEKISVTGLGRIPMGSWTHVAATFSYDPADSMLGTRVYINGYAYSTTLTFGGLADDGISWLDTTNNKPFQFTARDTREYLTAYESIFDEMAVWRRVLSQAEVQQLVNAGVPDVVVPPGVNYIQNGNFEDMTGWVPAGPGVLPPSGWDSHIWKNNPADQATGAAAIGGGTSARMVGALLSGSAQRGMAQSFVHATDPEWQFDMDFATNAPSDSAQRTVAFTLRTGNGAQLGFLVSDSDSNGMGDLMVGGLSPNGAYELISGMENKIAFDSDLSDLTGSIHHLRIRGHFDDATPNWDITLTDPSGTDYTVSGLTIYSGDMAALASGAGISQVGFYTYKSYGDWVIDNVSLVNVSTTPIPGDATGEGRVDEEDAKRLAANWGTATGATWVMGDFNGDCAVNAADASILAANWGHGVSEAAGVPEPAAALLLWSAALAASVVRRRRG